MHSSYLRPGRFPPFHPATSAPQTRNEQGGQWLVRALLTLLQQEREDAWVRQITMGGCLSLPAVTVCLPAVP